VLQVPCAPLHCIDGLASLVLQLKVPEGPVFAHPQLWVLAEPCRCGLWRTANAAAAGCDIRPVQVLAELAAGCATDQLGYYTCQRVVPHIDSTSTITAV